MKQVFLLTLLALFACTFLVHARWVFVEDDAPAEEEYEQQVLYAEIEQAPQANTVDPCELGVFRTDDQVENGFIKPAAALQQQDAKLAKLKEFIASASSSLTSPQVARILNSFSTLQAKINAFSIIDTSFGRLNPADAFAILKQLPAEAASKDCATATQFASFHKLILEDRSCVFGPIRGKYAVFIIDLSPSMWFQYKGVSRINYVRQELENVFKTQLKSDQLFNIIVFGGSAYKWSSTFLPATPENLQKALQYLRSAKEIGSTNINDSLELGLSLIPQSEKDTSIFFLTDGVANSGKYTKSSDIVNNIARINKNRANPVNINTVSFLLGAQRDEDPKESQAVMESLAKQNNGNFRAFEAK